MSDQLSSFGAECFIASFFSAFETDELSPSAHENENGQDVAFNVIYSLFIFALSYRFLILVGIATAFESSTS